jgi:hypothetical protein
MTSQRGENGDQMVVTTGKQTGPRLKRLQSQACFNGCFGTESKNTKSDKCVANITFVSTKKATNPNFNKKSASLFSESVGDCNINKEFDFHSINSKPSTETNMYHIHFSSNQFSRGNLQQIQRSDGVGVTIQGQMRRLQKA